MRATYRSGLLGFFFLLTLASPLCGSAQELSKEELKKADDPMNHTRALAYKHQIIIT